MVVGTVVTVADNGLAFTAVAERAGPFWSGRALGVQNTAQFLTASAVPPLAGLLIAHRGYDVAFLVAAPSRPSPRRWYRCATSAGRADHPRRTAQEVYIGADLRTVQR